MNRVKIQHTYINTDTDLISCYSGGGDHQTGILFIHGAAGDSRIFHHQLRHFSENYRTAAIDLQGHGKTGAPGGIPSREDYLRAVTSAVNALGCSRLILCGHSMGGGLALESAIRGLFPIHGLVLISAGDRFPVDPLLMDLVDRDMHGFIDLLVSRSFTRKSELIANMAKQALNHTTSAMVKNDLGICLDMDYSSDVPGINIPVLIIANSEDGVLSSDISRSLAQCIPGAKYVEFDSKGHLPFFENPESFNRELQGFISLIDI